MERHLFTIKWDELLFQVIRYGRSRVCISARASDICLFTFYAEWIVIDFVEVICYISLCFLLIYF